jgi:hypothetical protein
MDWRDRSGEGLVIASNASKRLSVATARGLAFPFMAAFYFYCTEKVLYALNVCRATALVG